jgi:hypothetical protein
MIRPVLRAGWSSQAGKEAVTLFNAIDIFKLNDTSVIIPSWVFYLDFLFPIVGFSALIFYRKDKYILSFAVISLVGLFLLKGLNPPFPSIFTFIFIHGFYIFRELWHISFLYGFGISFLIAFFLERIIISSRIKNSSTTYRSFYKPIYNLKNYFKFIVSSILISVIAISNGYPLLIGNFGGYLQTYNFPEEYHKLYDNLLTNSTYNTLILPLFTPIHYDGLKLEGLDPLVLDSANNIFEQLAFNLPSNPVTGLSTWLHSVMQENKTNNFGKLLSGFGIKYIILRKDFISNYPNYNDLGSYTPFTKRWYHSLEPFLNTQKDLIVISNTSHYKIYENANHAKKIFVPVAVANGLSDLNDLIYISNSTSLSDVAVYPFDKHSSLYDFIDLGQYTSSFNATEGWTTNRDWFGFNYLLASRVNVGALTMSNDSTFSFNLSLSKYNDKPVEIWMKAFTWHNGNLIAININGKESSYNLYSPHDGFSLIKIFDGKYANSNYNFLIRNIAGDNYVEGIYIKEKGIERDPSIKNKISMVGIEDENNLVSNPDFMYVKDLSSRGNTSSIRHGNNLVSNPDFMYVNNQSGLPLYWNDSLKNCNYIFKCTITSIDKWKGNTSFRLSTNAISTNNDTWSWIRGKEINVKPGEQYTFTTHMKLNEFATGSHIKLEGYNETSKGWHELNPQCPFGTDGPLEWHEFSCMITIPKDIGKIRPVLNAGWSSQLGKEAVTLFDAIDVSKLNGESRVQNINQLKDQSPLILKGYNELNPTLWNVRINNPSKSFVLGFAESYDPLWQARVYKDGKKVDVAKATPLYGIINGFQINQTGNLDIILRYTRQDWYETGLIVAAITFAFCLFYLFYDWRRNKQDKWTEKVEMKIRQVSKIKSVNFKRFL